MQKTFRVDVISTNKYGDRQRNKYYPEVGNININDIIS
jgi:hypothetical protein